MKRLILGMAVVLMTGCMTSSEKMANVSIGMTKQQVIDSLGKPKSFSAQGSSEYLSYIFCIDNCSNYGGTRQTGWYYVRLVNGTVESYGAKGDFDSTKTPTSRVEVERTDKVIQDVQVKEASDKYTELKKLKELFDSKIITQQEFDAQKAVILAK